MSVKLSFLFQHIVRKATPRGVKQSKKTLFLDEVDITHVRLAA